MLLSRTLRANACFLSSCTTASTYSVLHLKSYSSINAAEIKRNRDQLLHTFTANLRVSIINNTQAARKAQQAHKLGPIEAQLLGKTMAGVSLLSSFLEGEERIIAEMRGNGAVGLISAEAIHVGEVRGYIHLNNPEQPATSLSGALGAGILKMTKILYGQTKPLMSVVDLQKGDISSDFAHFLEQSEQIPCALTFETTVDEKGEVEFSGGVIIQTLPKAPEGIVQESQELLEKYSLVNHFLVKKQNLQEILQLVVPEKITEAVERTQVDFFCRCGIGSFKTKMSALGHEELHKMQEEGAREVSCVNCSKVYSMSDQDFDDMHKILDQKNSPPADNNKEK